MEPKTAQPAVFRESIFIGMCTLTDTQFYSKLKKLENAFPGPSYNLLTNNCVTFCDAMCYELMRRHIPSWVNRLATLADKVSCLLPEDLREESRRGNNGGGYEYDDDNSSENGRLLRPPTAASMQVPVNEPRKHVPFSGTGYRLSDSAPFPPPQKQQQQKPQRSVSPRDVMMQSPSGSSSSASFK